MKTFWRGISVLLPVGSVAYVLATALAVQTTGTVWRVKIGGYDPTDLLRGQYLVYRPQWDWAPDSKPDQGPCLCLTRRPNRPYPLVRNLDCSRARECDGWIEGAELANLEKFFLPENAAKKVERLVQDPANIAEITVVTNPKGKAMARDLFINGMRWIEAIAGEPNP